LSKDVNFWLTKLGNDSTDFAANVLLYYLYDREASIILLIKEKKITWVSMKNEEVEYWKEFFEKKEPPFSPSIK